MFSRRSTRRAELSNTIGRVQQIALLLHFTRTEESRERQDSCLVWILPRCPSHSVSTSSPNGPPMRGGASIAVESHDVRAKSGTDLDSGASMS